ncbi:MAG: PEP-CTERM sorting domain-containing protein [Nitrosomonas sp.]|nr:MAG: PEP-CTERM sorting domain-containing protein [Nitrosomonas sp.]
MKKTTLTLLAAATLVSGNANALIIDFEGFKPGDISIHNGGEHPNQNTPINGFFFNTYGHYDNSWTNSMLSLYPSYLNFNGTQHLSFFPGVQMAYAGTFSLHSFDMKISKSGKDYTVIGTTIDNNIITQTININHTNVAHYEFSGFDNLTKLFVVFGDGTSTSFSEETDLSSGYIDNFNLSATSFVPEPSTYAMLLAGLGLMGGVFRRK